MSAIQADYRTTKHVPSRKCYQLILEVPEEEFPHVCQVLGYPKTGENTYVGVALLSKKHTDIHTPITPKNIQEQTEGEKLRTRAVLLCKDVQFQDFARHNTIFSLKAGLESEVIAKNYICLQCLIPSRSQLANDNRAQIIFKELLEQYKTWQFENNYADNLDRV